MGPLLITAAVVTFFANQVTGFCTNSLCKRNWQTDQKYCCKDEICCTYFQYRSEYPTIYHNWSTASILGTVMGNLLCMGFVVFLCWCICNRHRLQNQGQTVLATSVQTPGTAGVTAIYRPNGTHISQITGHGSVQILRNPSPMYVPVRSPYPTQACQETRFVAPPPPPYSSVVQTSCNEHQSKSNGLRGAQATQAYDETRFVPPPPPSYSSVTQANCNEHQRGWRGAQKTD